MPHPFMPSSLSDRSSRHQAAIKRFEEEVVNRCLERAKDISKRHLLLALEEIEQQAWQTIIHAHCQFATHHPSLVDEYDANTEDVSDASHHSPLPDPSDDTDLECDDPPMDVVDHLALANASSPRDINVQVEDADTPRLPHPFHQPSTHVQPAALVLVSHLSIPATSIDSPGRPTGVKDGARIDLGVIHHCKPADIAVFLADETVSAHDCSVVDSLSQPTSGSVCSVDSWTAEMSETSCSSTSLSTSPSPSESVSHVNHNVDESSAADTGVVISAVDDVNSSPRSLVRSAACCHLDRLCSDDDDSTDDHLSEYGSDWHWVQSLMLIAAC